MPTVCKHFKDLFNAFVKLRFHFTEEEIRAQEKKKSLAKITCFTSAGAKLSFLPVSLSEL